MDKDQDHRPDGDSAAGGDHPRIRMHPRQGGEHRYRFARRWESRRRSRAGFTLWRLVLMDIGAVVLIYLVGRQILRKITG